MRVALRFSVRGNVVYGSGTRQLIDFVEGADGRAVHNRGAIGQVLDLAATGFSQRRRAIFQDEDIVSKLAPGLKLSLGHRLAAAEKGGEIHARGFGRHHEVMQINRHTVGNAAAQHRHGSL